MKLHALAAAAALTAASLGAGGVQAQSATDPTAAAPAALPSADYLMTAGQSDMFEIQEGRLAQQKGKSARVRAFGKQMVADHTKSTRDLMTAARASGMTPSPPQLSADQQQMIAQLQAASGQKFDRTYIQQQMQSHQMALQVHQGYMRGGDDRMLRKTASAIVPVVEHHIQELSEMASQGV